jgi:hypothetical protein
MFFCKACQMKNQWPESMALSYGKCEVCNKSATCFDVASSHLPLPKVTS